MTLTLKLLPLSIDSTKMPFLPAIRPPVAVIVTPHTRLPWNLNSSMCKYIRTYSVKSP